MADSPQTKIPSNTPDVHELVSKAKGIYDSLSEELEPTHNGEYVVIEVSSGKYFIGATKDEAMIKARKEFPNILLFVRRIGELEKNSHHISSFSFKKHASLF